jgi:hypothetical protein
MLTQETLKQFIEYNPATGEFWRLPTATHLMSLDNGEIITVGNKAHKHIVLMVGVRYFAKDLVYTLHYGTRPYKHIVQLRPNSLKISDLRLSHIPTAERMPLTQADISNYLVYNSKTGELRWRYTNPKKILLGSHDDKGHFKIMVDGHRHYASQLAWLYMTGAMPITKLKHRNGNNFDYRWANLIETLTYL